LFKLSTSQTCPLCPQVDSALHILSGCQRTQIRNMITERHNLLVCRMIFKAISKTGSLGICVVSMDIGSNERMTMQIWNSRKRIIPKWLFPPRFSDKDRLTSSRPDIVLVTPITAQTQKQQTTASRGVGSLEWQEGATEGDWEHPASSTASHQQNHQPQTAPTLRPQQTSAWHPPRQVQVLWGHQTWEPAERRKGTAQRPLQQPPRSLRYSLHHPFGCGRHLLQHSHFEAFQGTGSWLSKS